MPGAAWDRLRSTPQRAAFLALGPTSPNAAITVVCAAVMGSATVTFAAQQVAHPLALGEVRLAASRRAEPPL
jgi:hypothetical protein